jgi:hemerythrin-like metal-binding protein
MIRYTQAHFAAEERLMEKGGYPDIVAHKRQHADLTKKVLDFQKDFVSGRLGLGVEVMQCLGAWLQGHIRGTDKKYVPYLHAKGVH